MRVVTMSQRSAERYAPSSDREVCISITSPGSDDANLSAFFADVLRLQFADDSFDGWQERAIVITDDQAMRVARFLAKHVDAPQCVIHCTVGASRSVSMALAIEEADLAVYVKPDWWNEVDRPAIPNPGVYRRVLFALQNAQVEAWRQWGATEPAHA